jgi:mitochondrial chaperone BCS1
LNAKRFFTSIPSICQYRQTDYFSHPFFPPSEQKEEKEAKEVKTISISFFDPLTQTECLLKEGRKGSQRGETFIHVYRVG